MSFTEKKREISFFMTFEKSKVASEVKKLLFMFGTLHKENTGRLQQNKGMIRDFNKCQLIKYITVKLCNTRI